MNTELQKATPRTSPKRRAAQMAWSQPGAFATPRRCDVLSCGGRPPRCAASVVATEPVAAPAAFPPLRLGSLNLQSAALLSPLEAVSCVGFRELCFQHGAGIVWPEMLRAAALARGNSSTFDLADTFSTGAVTGLQLLASSGEELTAALRRLEAAAATTRPHLASIRAIDLNLGCPSPAVIRAGAGPALLKRRAKLAGLFDALVAFKASSGLSIGAVGVKIRLGLNATEAEARVYLPLVDLATAAGLDYVTVHARHAGQRSRDTPRWDAIGEAKARVRGSSVHAFLIFFHDSLLLTPPSPQAGPSLAIIGNGDVFSFEDAVEMRRRTGCDGVMLARAAIRNPAVFNAFLPGAALPRGDGVRGCWMDVPAVDAAEQRYVAASARHGTKPKYTAFHAANFARLRRVAETGDVSLPVASPSTIHLS